MSFPLNSNDPYIKSTGERSTLGAEIGSGGGGGGGSSVTPDYENEILIVGIEGDYEYYIPMSKRYIGPGFYGYQITTKSTSSSEAKIDLYSLIYTDEGQIEDKTLIKTLTTKGDTTYADDYISISYVNLNWTVTLLQTMYNTEGVAYTSPITWSYSSEVDYTLLDGDPTATT